MLSVTYPICNPELHPNHTSFGMVLNWWDNQSIIHLRWDTPCHVELSITKIICRKFKLLRSHVKYHCRNWNCSWQQLLGNVMTSGYLVQLKTIPTLRYVALLSKRTKITMAKVYLKLTPVTCCLLNWADLVLYCDECCTGLICNTTF